MCFRGGGVSGVWSKTILLQKKNFGPFPKNNTLGSGLYFPAEGGLLEIVKWIITYKL